MVTSACSTAISTFSQVRIRDGRMTRVYSTNLRTYWKGADPRIPNAERPDLLWGRNIINQIA